MLPATPVSIRFVLHFTRGSPDSCRKQTADAVGPNEGEGGSTAKKRERKTAGGDAALLSDFDLFSHDPSVRACRL
jgi:hypothetical protein